MYRLLIVDDEPFIVDGLMHLFSEVDIELEIYTAYTVTEAMKHVMRTRIDIVISDMRMPIKNGLQFIDELLTFWPQCRIIFLSGYDDFDYVYHAMKRNIDSYILKTEDDEILIAAVKKSIMKIEEKRSYQKLIKTTESKFAKMIPIVKRKVLEALAKGESVTGILKSPVIEKDAFDIELDGKWFTIAGRVESIKSSESSEERLQNLYYIESLFIKELHPNLSIEFFMFEHSLAVWFIQPKKVNGVFYKEDKPEWGAIKEYLKGYLENVQDNYLSLLQTKVSFVIGDEPVDCQVVSHAFHKICESLKIMSYYTNEMIIVDLGEENPFFEDEIETSNYHFWKKDLLILESAISVGDHHKSLEIVNKIFEELFNSSRHSNIVKTEFFYSISLLLLEFLRNKDLYHHLVRENEKLTSKIIDNFPIIIDTKEKIDYFVKKICEYQTTKREEGKHNLVSHVNEYIKENISGDLSLTTIAKSVYFNPSYLSRFYKEQTGINISDYINQLKIEMAKYYLTETEMFVQTIASKLGFSSPSYFTMFFKKNINQSPQDYREQRWRK
ncbi:response regulator [Bacillus sp. FSL K6-3431]|uniref:response regulator n=1 Tax=Bacillus sp. FSL K6-3431 TaxID=2921500 RepID=UPI0030FB136D